MICFASSLCKLCAPVPPWFNQDERDFVTTSVEMWIHFPDLPKATLSILITFAAHCFEKP